LLNQVAPCKELETFFVSCLAFNTPYYQLTLQNEKSFSAEKACGLNLKASEFDFLIISALFFCNWGKNSLKQILFSTDFRF